MAETLSYETKTCSRCGGGGRYSYCVMYGDTCFKCRGKGTVLSAAGAKAAAAVTAFIADNFSVLVENLKAGDRIKTTEGVVRTVTTVTIDSVNRFGSTVDGVTTWRDAITLTYDKPVKSPYGAYSATGMAAGTTVVKAVAGDDWLKVVAFAKTLKKGVTIVEKTS